MKRILRLVVAFLFVIGGMFSVQSCADHDGEDIFGQYQNEQGGGGEDEPETAEDEDDTEPPPPTRN